MNYDLSRKALRQIEEIIRYTDENFGEHQTSEYVDGLYHSFDILADNPRMGRRFDQHRRRYIYRSHHVYYRLLGDRILIVDIRNALQNAPTE
jgi:toxin ParE1/3/4